MSPRRRWIQFSLRGFIVALTIGCLLLGYRVEKARRQCESVKSIEEVGGIVRYDWQPMVLFFDHGKGPLFCCEALDVGSSDTPQPRGPGWLRRFVGDEYFQNAQEVYLFIPEPQVRKAIPFFRMLPDIKRVHAGDWISDSTCEELKTELAGRKLILEHFDERLSVLLSDMDTWPDFLARPPK